MDDLGDPATISAVAALVVAFVAMLVALAQALQQYLASGTLMRLGDRLVFGPVPGGTRRQWSWKQFRFRVLYTIPKVRISKYYYDLGRGHDEPAMENLRSLWYTRTKRAKPDESPDLPSIHEYMLHTDATIFDYRHPLRFSRDTWTFSELILRPWRFVLFNLTRHLSAVSNERSPAQATPASNDVVEKLFKNDLADLYQVDRLHERYFLNDKFLLHFRGPSEASWVSFWRIAQMSCSIESEYYLVQGDTDRCPSDLQVLPMGIPLKDIVTVCFLLKMEVCSSQSDKRLVQMEGSAGTLTTSRHPLLGTIVRFFPDANVIGYKRQIPLIVARIWGRMTVAGHSYTWDQALNMSASNFRSERQYEKDFALVPWRPPSVERTHTQPPLDQDGVRLSTDTRHSDIRSNYPVDKKASRPYTYSTKLDERPVSNGNEGMDAQLSGDRTPACLSRLQDDLSDTRTNFPSKEEDFIENYHTNSMTSTPKKTMRIRSTMSPN